MCLATVTAWPSFGPGLLMGLNPAPTGFAVGSACVCVCVCVYTHTHKHTHKHTHMHTYISYRGVRRGLDSRTNLMARWLSTKEHMGAYRSICEHRRHRSATSVYSSACKPQEWQRTRFSASSASSRHWLFIGMTRRSLVLYDPTSLRCYYFHSASSNHILSLTIR